MAKRSNGNDSFDSPNEGNYSQSDSDDMADRVNTALEADVEAERQREQNAADDATRFTAYALAAEPGMDQLRYQLQLPMQQIVDLFRLMLDERGRPIGLGPTAGKPDDSPEVQQFKKRTQVLKQAYPNTRI